MLKVFLYIMIMLPVSCFAQVIISGKVLNQADTKPLANATVFLNNATIGAETADDGTFTLHNIKSGKYEMVISIIGFETYKRTIMVNNNFTVGDIKLLPKQIILNEVSIKANHQTDYDRQKYLSWFRDEFLGTSNIALNCKIVNPEALYLHYNQDKNILTASSSDFLIIENPDLGYRIKYLLNHFLLNLNDRNALRVQFDGSVLFENMTGTLSQEQRWEKRRRDVYQNSSMHFLRAALNDQMEREGFMAFPLDMIPNPQRPPDSLIKAKTIFFKELISGNNNYQDSLSFWKKKAALPKMIKNNNLQPLDKGDIIKPSDQKGVYALFPGNSNGGIQLMYDKYHLFSRRFSNESTRLDFKKPFVLFDDNGIILDPDGLLITGAWSRNRIAELLPVDYEQLSQNIIGKEGNVDQSPVPGPSVIVKNDLMKIAVASDSLNKILPPEKLYLQFDKPYYAIGDTIWFKAYLFNAASLTPTDKSGILNIDIANDSDKVIKQYRLPVGGRLTWGNIDLDEKEFNPGTYTIHAYTNWMRNFGDDYFFNKTFYVSSSNENNLLVNTLFRTSVVNNAKVLSAKLLFSDMAKLPFAVAPLQLEVMNGSKRLYKQKLQTGVDGILNINFDIPEQPSNLVIVAQNEQKTKRAVIPVILSSNENADIQFLPEGGNLVAGLPAHIGFKAMGEDGKGIDISGIVVDHNQNKIAEFKVTHNGMGSFDLAVADGETYTAKVTLPGGMQKEYPLPAVKNTGMVLNVRNPVETDSLTVSVAATDDVVQSGNSYFLVGKARGIVCYAAVFDFHGHNSLRKKIAKSLFPTGIAHFTILTTKYQPVNERLVFINNHDNLNIKITTNKAVYDKRDSVSLKLKVTDKGGNPIQGNFSMAVTDDQQVKTDTLNNENILAQMLLTSDLKGYVEEPGYYLSSKTTEAWQALDNLLLTQGWVGYDWHQVLNPPVINYPAEHDFAVTGNVVNVFNKPVKGTNVLLFSKSPSILMDTVTDQNGKFVFDRFPRVDTPIFILKAVNKNGKSFNVRINMDEVKPPDFVKPVGPLVMPWYVNSDSTLLNYAKTNALIKRDENFLMRGHILSEVKISAKKIIRSSQNLNGDGNADFALDEKDLEKVLKKNWLQLLEENVKGFREMELEPNYPRWYYMHYKSVFFIIDGIFLNDMYPSLDFLSLKTYLQSHNAEDIKGIEVMSSDVYVVKYSSRFFPFVNSDVLAFVEITTRSGHGPIIDNTPGMYLYKPLPISWPTQFYKPKYTLKDTINHKIDLRSTIDWEPSITTGINGEVRISFYTADKPSSYTLIIEGADMNGNLGYRSGKIVVN